MVVDDEVEMRIALETTLKREGHGITLAENGQQALERFSEGTFDLVLTDVKMPKMNGVELLKVLKKKLNIGVLICGSGMGMAMTANKHKNIRAALCYSVKNAKLSRLHNDANVITLGSRFTNNKTAFNCLNAFLNTKFEGGRHKKRLKKI